MRGLGLPGIQDSGPRSMGSQAHLALHSGLGLWGAGCTGLEREQGMVSTGQRQSKKAEQGSGRGGMDCPQAPVSGPEAKR